MRLGSRVKPISSSGLQDKHFKMAAAEGKFVWLETLRKARKTSLVQDGKWRILALTLLQVHSLNSYGIFIADSRSIWLPVIIIVNKKTNTTYNMKLKKVFDVYAVLVTALILRLIHSEKAVVFF